MESGIPVSRRALAGEAVLLLSQRRPLKLSSAQADALACLIQTQLDAYAEAAPGGAPSRSDGTRPFTGGDLDLVEPLLSWLKGAPRA